MSLKLGSFNQSCLTTPVNPKSGHPSPSYERIPEVRRAVLDSEEVSSDEIDDNIEDIEIAESGNVFDGPNQPSKEFGKEPCDFYNKLQQLKYENLLRLQKFDDQLFFVPPFEPVEPKPKAKNQSKPVLKRDDLERATFNSSKAFRPTEVKLTKWSDKLDDFEDLSQSDDDPAEKFLWAKGPKRSRVSSAPPKHEKVIPEPFKMTIREEEKSREKAMMQKMLQRNQNQMEMEEEEALKRLRNFKARGVPGHVYKEIFKTMMEKEPHRYFLRQKPQTLHKTQSTPNLANGGFSALPFPSHIFSGYAYEMMKVNKEYREMQKTTRQKELLAKSSLPPRMKSLYEKEALKQTLKAGRNKENQDKNVRPVKAKPSESGYKPVPDFEKLYQNFTHKMEKKKFSKVLTVIQPFSFEPDVQKYLEIKAKRRRSPSPPPFPTSEMKRSLSVPNLLTSALRIPSGNTTSELRAKHIRSKIQKYGHKDQVEERQRVLHEIKQRELRSNPAWQELTKEIVNYDDLEAKKAARSMEAREREREYKMELEKMMNRVQQQPTLFQRQSRLSATHNVEKRYHEVLKKQGLSAAEIEKTIQVKRERRASRTLSEISDNSKLSRSPYFRYFTASVGSIYQESDEYSFKS